MDILKDRVKPLYFKYLVAASGSAMVASIFGMIDAMMVGKYHGPSGNAAIAIFTPVWSFVYSLGILSGIGGSVLFANKRGSGNEKSAQEHFSLSIIYGVVLSVLAMIIIGLFSIPPKKIMEGADVVLLSFLGGSVFAISTLTSFHMPITSVLADAKNPHR